MLTRFIHAVPDAVVLVGVDGAIVAVNDQACRLFGYTVEELTGRPVEDLLPEAVRERHVEHRTGFTALAETARPMAEGQDLFARHRTGREIPVDIGLAPMDTAHGPTVAAFIRDASVRRQANADRQRLHDVQVARKHALEVNDNVLQGLTTAMWQLDQQELVAAAETMRRTLEDSRQMVRDLLGGEPDVHGGDLVRGAPAPSMAAAVAPPSPARGNGRRSTRVVLADDAADLRLILRLRLSKLSDIEVVAEASDGQEAIELVEELRPDVVVLDLSMPRLDGLQAAQQLRASHPDLRIIVLSGYPSASMEALALEAGADVYIEKGPDLTVLERAVLLQAS